jgi:hypothetical protein
MCGLWLVVAARVQPQVAAQLAAGSEHADVPVVDEDHDGRAGMAQADVVQPAVVSQDARAAAVELFAVDPDSGRRSP